MITIDYSGAEVNYTTFDIKKKIDDIKKKEKPAFVLDKPALSQITKLAEKQTKYKNVIIVGNGGSITSSRAYYDALGSKKNLIILDSMEPDYINSIKEKYKKKDTLVIIISKSGNIGKINNDIATFNLGFFEKYLKDIVYRLSDSLYKCYYFESWQNVLFFCINSKSF